MKILFSLTAAITAVALGGQAIACSCIAPPDWTRAEAEEALTGYEVVEGRLAQFVRAPDCEAGPDGGWYQTYILAAEDGRSLQVRQAAQQWDGRCEALSSATCGSVLPQEGRYVLAPVSDGVYRYPLSCELVMAEGALAYLDRAVPDGGALAEDDPCGN